MNAPELTETFLGKIFSGEMEAALDLVATDATFVGTRPEPSESNPLFGTFRGHSGARDFFARFAELLEPGRFEVEAAFGDAQHACMYGKLEHTVRATGRPFPSDWALVVKAQGGKISSYHVYEDTAMLRSAMQPDGAGE